MQLQAIATKLNHFYDWTNVDSDSSYLVLPVYIWTVNSPHGSYRWIIMLEKCGRPDLNVQMNNRHPWQLKKIKILGAVWELPAKQHYQSS